MTIIEGEIISGRKLGRMLGFPTANMSAEHLPHEVKDGVYAAWFEFDGRRLPCMLNIGIHPTLPGGGRTIEAHLLDFDGTLYGQRARVQLVGYLRGEQCFPSPEALREQLVIDERASRDLLGI